MDSPTDRARRSAVALGGSTFLAVALASAAPRLEQAWGWLAPTDRAAEIARLHAGVVVAIDGAAFEAAAAALPAFTVPIPAQAATHWLTGSVALGPVVFAAAAAVFVSRRLRTAFGVRRASPAAHFPAIDDRLENLARYLRANTDR